ncbi:MAG: hypothetical protein KDC54_03210 [Lewinella sp.]|nr:hypothetical protein [Lewinella sp.]
MSNPQYVVFFWLALGLILGVWFGLMINSFTIGIPMGLALSMLVGKTTYRISRGLTRLMR